MSLQTVLLVLFNPPLLLSLFYQTTCRQPTAASIFWSLFKCITRHTVTGRTLSLQPCNPQQQVESRVTRKQANKPCQD
jgi:hypothetical protein